MTTADNDTNFSIANGGWGWKGTAALGVLMVIGGVLAFLNPFAASLTVEAVAGAGFLVAGLVQLWQAATEGDRPMRDRWLGGGLGALLVLMAVLLMLNPLAGLVTLTIVVAMVFALIGGVRVAIALRERPEGSWGWILAAGLMSLALAALIVLGLPASAAGILGILLAVDLTMAGAMTLALAWHLHRKSEG